MSDADPLSRAYCKDHDRYLCAECFDRVNRERRQFELAWENAMQVSGVNKEWIAIHGEHQIRQIADHWWQKGFGAASGTLWWPDPAKKDAGA